MNKYVHAMKTQKPFSLTMNLMQLFAFSHREMQFFKINNNTFNRNNKRAQRKQINLSHCAHQNENM